MNIPVPKTDDFGLSYIKLSDKPIIKQTIYAQEAEVIFDVDADGNIVGIEFFGKQCTNFIEPTLADVVDIGPKLLQADF